MTLEIAQSPRPPKKAKEQWDRNAPQRDREDREFKRRPKNCLLTRRNLLTRRKVVPEPGDCAHLRWGPEPQLQN